MGIKKFKPVTPTLRYRTVSDFAEVTKSEPEKSLLRPHKKTGGRNNAGRITSRHRGGGHKRRYRVIDFKRTKHDVPARVAAIEYDPNRSARIALLHYADGEKRYIIAPKGLEVGAQVRLIALRRHGVAVHQPAAPLQPQPRRASLRQDVEAREVQLGAAAVRRAADQVHVQAAAPSCTWPPARIRSTDDS